MENINHEILEQFRIYIGNYFKECRLEKNITKSELAERIGVTENTIQKIETGKFNYNIDIIAKLSVVLEFRILFESKEQVSPRFLLQKSKIPNNFILTDIENNIVCQFEKGKFNETQKFNFIENINFSPGKLASIMREFADYLNKNHTDII